MNTTISTLTVLAALALSSVAGLVGCAADAPTEERSSTESSLTVDELRSCAEKVRQAKAEDKLEVWKSCSGTKKPPVEANDAGKPPPKKTDDGDLFGDDGDFLDEGEQDGDADEGSSGGGVFTSNGNQRVTCINGKCKVEHF